MKSLFIVFEGIDGSGSTTQANLLTQFFEREGKKAVTTSEPSSGPIGNIIRLGMKGRVIFNENSSIFDRQMAYLFAADRHDHLYNSIDGVIKLISEGVTVISTRYYFSSFAYHVSCDADYSLIQKLNSNFPMPDLVIYLDNPISSSLERISQRKHIDAYENYEKLEKVKSNYFSYFSDYKGNLLNVDATGTIEDIHSTITSYIRDNFL